MFACYLIVLFISLLILLWKGKALSSGGLVKDGIKPGAASRSENHEYTKVFPPLLRDNLSKLAATLPPSTQQRLGDLKFNQSVFERLLLGFDEEYREADESKYIYSGFSVREVKALGDFPDYAALSGVPLPKPWKEFDIDKAVSRPYRPLRWPYHQTMSLTKMEPDFFLDLDGTYKSHIAWRKRMFMENGSDCMRWLPGSELALKEALEMSIQFLCARFPQYFSLSEDKKVFENKILCISEHIYERHPFLVLLDHVPEDFAIMIRNPQTGKYHLRAALMFASLGYNVAAKIGKGLPEIHTPVPDYKERMELSMDRFFTKMPADKPIQRGSWGIEIDKPYYMPPGHPHEKYRGYQMQGLQEDRLFFRVDWQRLRRMPLSGALVFVNRPLFTPLPKLCNEPYIPSLCLRILEQGKPNLMGYKGTWHIEHVAKPALKRYEDEQRKTGLVEDDWEVKTLPECPFFPGALEEWQMMQGFSQTSP